MTIFRPPLKRLLFQILLLLVIYSISRAVFTLINSDHFKGLTAGSYLRMAIYGLRFDISAILTLNAPYIILLFLSFGLLRYRWWERSLNILFIVVNLIALAFELSDWAYYSFTLKRATSDVLDMVGRKGDFINLLPHFLTQYWYIFLVFIAVCFCFIKINNAICQRYPAIGKNAAPDLKQVFIRILAFVIITGLSIMGIRGGVQNQPLNISFALQAAGNDDVPIVLNTPYSIISTISNNKLTEVKFYSDAALKQYVSPVRQYPGRPFNKKNVVVIILESFSKQFTGLGKFKSYTPFLDSLSQHAYVCRNAYSNAMHSAEGIPAVVAGIPSLMDGPFTTSYYGTNAITALPNVLKKEGYSSAFFHGATNGTMSFDMFCNNAGFDQYYGRSEYPDSKDYDGAWGIWDEPYLQYFAHQLAGMPQPFFSTVFTVTSHDPFKVPEKYKNVLPKGGLPIQQCIAYTDLALREFFANISKQPFFNNTLFVITPDHCALQTQDYRDHANLGFYRIPIIFYAPGDSIMKGGTDELVQQIDILPSVLDYLGYNKPFFAFGNSIFDTNAKRFLTVELSGRYQCLSGNYIAKMNNYKAREVFNYAADTACNNNIIDTDEGKVRLGMESYFKAFIQLYNTSLIHNKMRVDEQK